MFAVKIRKIRHRSKIEAFEGCFDKDISSQDNL
jgi:hypothetical protein